MLMFVYAVGMIERKTGLQDRNAHPQSKVLIDFESKAPSPVLRTTARHNKSSGADYPAPNPNQCPSVYS
jgi:hypothetical protein